MSHRVPDLDANHGGSSGLNHRDHLDIRSGKGEAGVGHLDHSAVCFEQEEGDLAQHRKQASVHVPENVFSYHIPWMERESENNNKHACAMGQECMPAGEAPLSHLPFQDDEMLSWLQYPLEDSFDRNYCSEQLFEQAPKSPSHHVQDLFSSQSEKLPAIGLPSQPTELFHSNMGGRKVATDTAIAMGAHRVLGLLPHAGAEAFHFHRALTTGQPSAPREICDVPAPEATNTLHTTPYAMDSHSVFSLPSQNVIKQNALNFSLFSGPVAATKTSLQIMGTSSGPSNMKRIRQPYITHGNEGLSSVAESTAAASVTGLSFLVESDSGDQVKGMKQGTSSTLRQKALPPMLSMRRDNNAVKEEVKLNACLKMSATIGSESFETVDVTLTSHSGGSGNSTEKSAKETVAFSCKRKSHPAEDSECESEDAEEVAAREQQPAPAGGRPSPTKRTRAAEIHNQSERRRRNKINDRMKALQELIPNANKSDKASMLDEAIEYVKTLQAQLQLMSMRTGMVVPSVITPPGMQYPALSQQRLSHSHMNMGMGVSTVLGMGMSDASATSVSVGHAVVALPSFHGQPAPAPPPGPAYNVAGYQLNGWSSSVVHQAQSHMHMNEKHDSTQQLQPLHLNMHMDANMYRAFMQQQRGNQKLENPTSEEIPNNEVYPFFNNEER